MKALSVEGLRVELTVNGAEIVDDIALELAPGEIVGLVGESGSGKTTVAVALLGHAKRGTRIARRLDPHRRDGRARARAPGIAQRPRDDSCPTCPRIPAAALNPSLRIGAQLDEVMSRARRARRRPRADPGCARRGAASAGPATSCSAIRISSPAVSSNASASRSRSSCGRALIVLDEPTTGLDVTTQAHVLATVRELCASHDTAAVYVSHDLAAVAALAHARARDVRGAHRRERADGTLFEQPAHPYTRQLIGAIPDIASRRLLEAIPGRVPAPGAPPDGVRVFAPPLHVCDRGLQRGRTTTRRGRPQGHHARCIRVTPRSPRPHPPPPARARRSRLPGPCSRSRRECVPRRPARCLDAVAAAPGARVPRARRRVGLGQDDACASDHRPARPALGRHPLPRRGAARDRARAPQGATAAPSSTSSRAPTSSLNPRRTIGEIVAHPARALLRAPRTRSPMRAVRRSCSSASRSRPSRRTATPASSRAASASASRLHARSRRARGPDLRRDHLGPRHVGASRDRAPARGPAAIRRSSRSCS